MRFVRWFLIIGYLLLFWGTHKYVEAELKENVPKAAEAVKSIPEPVITSVRGLVFQEKIEHVVITVGGINIGLDHGNLSRDTSKRQQHMFVFGGSEPIVPYVENGRLFCDVEFFSKFGIPPIKLEHNILSGKPEGWDWNQNDRAIEVVNEKLVPVFQMYWKDDNHIVFNGVFPTMSGLLLCSEGHTEMLGDRAVKRLFPSGVIPVNIKRIFKYPSYKFFGKVDENSN